MNSQGNNFSPLIIGGLGGSGTRVYRAIAETAGYAMLVAPWFLRIWMSDMHDNWVLKVFYSKWIDVYLKNELSEFHRKRMRIACRMYLWICGPLSYRRRRWGWKNPRTVFLIPFFKELYSSMRFIHVIRDGRDHAFHPRFPYLAHQECLLESHERELDDHLRKALFWSRVNKMGEDSARQHLKDRYLRSRLEDLCADPVKEAARVLVFLDIQNHDLIKQVASFVRTPASLGRWRPEPEERIAAVEMLIGDDLARYGYPLTSE